MIQKRGDAFKDYSPDSSRYSIIDSIIPITSSDFDDLISIYKFPSKDNLKVAKFPYLNHASLEAKIEADNLPFDELFGDKVRPITFVDTDLFNINMLDLILLSNTNPSLLMELIGI